MRRTLVLLACALLAACEDPAPPARVRLAELAPFAAVVDQGARTHKSGSREVRLAKVNGEEWIEAEIRRKDWKAMDQQPGAWRLTPPFRSTGRGPTDTVRLGTRTQRFEQVRRGDEPPEELAGTFAMVGTWLVLQLAPGEEPPEEATLAVRVMRRSRAGATQRVDGRRFSGDGLSVWPGERIEVLLDFPPASVLRVATCVEALLASESARSYRFRIRVDDRVLLDHEQAEAKDGSLVAHELVLPRKGRGAARLVFEVTGPLGATAFLAPVIGPPTEAPAAPGPAPGNGDAAAAPAPGPAAASRAADPRPDLVLFVADTFRADNMALYGGALGLTPTLDALAAESRCFTDARSVATYTAPAHATLFTGQLPHGVATDGFDKSLPDQAQTIAEALAAAGYRTGAITGAVIVSRSFGFAQGFEWWDELTGGMDATRQRVRAFLEAGDGRPTFLFVHTYRAHTPYAPDPETLARLAGDTEDLDFARANAELEALLAAERTPEEEARLAVLARRLEVLYRAGVAGLDRELARFLDEPAVRALLRRGFLVFTSDHGEAFLEHGELYHAGRVYDEQLRVPLFVRGPGIAPERRGGPVTLADVAPTLAELAGLARRPDWQGVSLLAAVETARPFQYAFECRDDRESTVAVVSDGRKLIGLLDPASRALVGTHAAFDLGADPREERDLLPEGASWTNELYRHLEERRETLLLPRIGPAPALLDQEQRASLRALGYGGSQRDG